MTNFEKIKAMSVRNMAMFLCEIGQYGCFECPVYSACDIASCDELEEWLESEAEE